MHRQKGERPRSYECQDLAEASAVLGREWSPHRVAVRDDAAFRLQFRIRHIGADVSLSTLSYGTAARATPVERDDVVLLKMPLRGVARMAYPGCETIAAPGKPGLVAVPILRDAAFSDDFEAVVLRVRSRRLHAYAEAALGRRLRQPLAFASPDVLDEASWDGWQPMAAYLASLGADQGRAIPARVSALMEELILGTLLTSLPNTAREELCRPARPVAPRHVRRAADAVRADPAAAITTALLARQAGVSIRALFNGFRAAYGMSPAQFVRTVRLERAREDLLAGSGTVAAVAEAWGFSHAGNFAMHYRRRYGELPAETLRATAC